MGIEALTWILSLGAAAVLLVLVGRLFVTLLKIALVATVLYFLVAKLYPSVKLHFNAPSLHALKRV